MEIGVQSINEFVRSTTAHGFNRAYESQSMPIRCMWLIFLLASMGGFGYNLALLVTNYMSTPISATISPGAIQFQTPDITLCSVAPVSSTNYYETVTKRPDVFGQMYAQATAVQTNVVTKGLELSSDILLQVSRDVFDSNLLLKYLGHKQEWFIVRCRYKGISCSFADFSGFWDSKFGNCFRFQPSDQLVNATKDIVEFKLDLILFTDTAPVVSNENSQTIYSMLTAGITFEGEYDASKSGGAILFYGDKDHYPRDYINLSPGVQSYVNFQMVEHRYVNRDSKPCKNDNGFVYYEDSSASRIRFIRNRIDCQYRMLLDKILTDCNCFSTRIAPPYTTAAERLNASRCQYLDSSTNKTAFIVKRNCEKLRIETKSTYFNQIVAQCVPNCIERIYTPVISMTSWPLNSLAVTCKDSVLNEAINRLLANNVSVPDTFYYFLRNLTSVADVQRDFSSNFAQVSLGAYTAFSELVKETESVQIFDLFSSIGGILGLYLGMSLLTVCELCELFFVVIAELQTAAKGYKDRKQWKTQLRHKRQAAIRALSRVLAVQEVDDPEKVSGSDASMDTGRTSDTSLAGDDLPTGMTKPQTKVDQKAPKPARFPSVSRMQMIKRQEATARKAPPQLQAHSQPQRAPPAQQGKPRVARVVPAMPGQPVYRD